MFAILLRYKNNSIDCKTENDKENDCVSIEYLDHSSSHFGISKNTVQIFTSECNYKYFYYYFFSSAFVITQLYIIFIIIIIFILSTYCDIVHILIYITSNIDILM